MITGQKMVTLPCVGYSVEAILLHNQTALRLKGALLYRSGVAVASFPYQLEE